MREGGFEPPKALSREISKSRFAACSNEQVTLKSRAFDHFATPAYLDSAVRNRAVVRRAGPQQERTNIK